MRRRRVRGARKETFYTSPEIIRGHGGKAYYMNAAVIFTLNIYAKEVINFFFPFRSPPRVFFLSFCNASLYINTRTSAVAETYNSRIIIAVARV